MKTTAVVYPNLKQDSDGKFTESLLTLVKRKEFIGIKIPVTNEPENESREYKRKSYITF